MKQDKKIIFKRTKIITDPSLIKKMKDDDLIFQNEFQDSKFVEEIEELETLEIWDSSLDKIIIRDEYNEE